MANRACGESGNRRAEASTISAISVAALWQVCTLPGTADTRHFVSNAEFAAMKPGSVAGYYGHAVKYGYTYIVDVYCRVRGDEAGSFLLPLLLFAAR